MHKNKKIVTIVRILSLGLMALMALYLLFAYVVAPIIFSTIFLWAITPSQAQIQEMKKVEEEFLRVYPLQDAGDDVGIKILLETGSACCYGIYIRNLTDTDEQDKVIQLLKDITREHVYITPEVTLYFTKVRTIQTEAGPMEAIYDVESTRIVTLIE